MEFVRAVRALSSASGTESSTSRKIRQVDLEGWGLRGVTLRPYQLEGLSWLVERHKRGHGCILGDEMGLGKTLQVGSVLCVYRLAGADKGDMNRPTAACSLRLTLTWTMVHNQHFNSQNIIVWTKYNIILAKVTDSILKAECQLQVATSYKESMIG